MFGLKRKLGIKVMVILLFSVFIPAGLTVTQAYGQPLDSPLYNHTNAKTVESMNGSDVKVQDTNVAPSDIKTYTAQAFCKKSQISDCCSTPVVSTSREILFVLTLAGGACWAILRKK
jgi:hypothetical protein